MIDVQSMTSFERREHLKHVMHPPKFTSQNIRKYMSTRFSSLFVPREELAQYSKQEIFNPFAALRELNWKQWNFFLLGFSAWTLDAFDFFCVSLNASAIAKDLNVSVKDITWGITLVLMLRSIGAVIFGLWGDRYGRTWPYIVNMALLTVIQIGTGFVTTYKEFLGVRAIFGIAMGGIFGTCSAIAMEDCPKAARGIISGMFQQGYAFGYLLAIMFQRVLADNTKKEWRTLFWFSAGLALPMMVWRYFTPETDTYIKQQQLFDEHAKATSKAQEFKDEGKKAMKTYGLFAVYAVLMMAGFNFMSHGSQDLYPTLLTSQLGFGKDKAAVTNSVANLGAICGGMTLGHASTFVGRRLTVIIGCILGGAMIYPWAFLKGNGIMAGAFWLQFFVQGNWGVVPIHLAELSPPQFKSFVSGVAYQLGNLASSASSTIEATIGERFPIYNEDGTLKRNSSGDLVYNYSKTMAIFMGAVFAYVLLIMFVGPENRGADLSIDRDETDSIADVVGEEEQFDEDKKPEVVYTERV